MSKTRFEKNLDRQYRGLVIIAVISAVLLFLLVLLFVFHVTQVEISGNHHYTDTDIEDAVMKGPLGQNSLYLELFNQKRKFSSMPFIDTLSVDIVSPHSIRIEVAEKNLVGYVRYDDAYWYFDKEGMVLIRSDKNESDYAALLNSADGTGNTLSAESRADESTGTPDTGDSSFTTSVVTVSGAAAGAVITPEAITIEAGTGNVITPVPAESDASSSGTENTGTVSGSAVSGAAAADSAVSGASSAGSAASESSAPEVLNSTATMSAAAASETSGSASSSSDSKTAASQNSGSGVTASDDADNCYIPFIEGLSFSDAAVGEILPVKDTAVFSMLSSLKNIVNKNNIIPDAVMFDENGNLLLTYGEAQVNLGSGSYLEARLEELTGILPSLSGLSGILHLENYDGSQNRLIFDKK